MMEEKFQESTEQVEKEIQQDKVNRQKQLESLWGRMMSEYDPNNPELMENLNNEWTSMMADWKEDKFGDHWQAAQDLEEMQYLDMNKHYAFAKDNKFANQTGLHREFIEQTKKGDVNAAMLALEAHLAQHPEDHLGWRMLASLAHESDMDQKCVSAVSQALAVEPTCLRSLLQIGTSCANILDEIHSVMYLHRWLICNPKYAKLAGGVIVDENRVEMGDYTQEEILAINVIILERFAEARNAGGLNDPDFCLANAIVSYIGREYKLAVDMMNRALDIDPKNYSNWNKLGACLAQLYETEMSRKAYRQALDLKPNYVRPWVNLGMTYSAKVSPELISARVQQRDKLLPKRPLAESADDTCLDLHRVSTRLQ
jgi:peroxin-5